MKNRILVSSWVGFLAAACLASGAGADNSTFASTVDGLDIGNAHLVLHLNGTILRGSAPSPTQASELARKGVTDVVIFKNETGREVQDEIQALGQAGISRDHVTAIPFRWSRVPAFSIACRQVLTALRVLDRVAHVRGRTAYFHCTMGEDRTGLLAGLFDMLENRESTRGAFDKDLCAHGYEAGDPHKPGQVVRIVRGELTPIFLKMASLIESGTLSPERLDDSACDQDVAAPEASRYICETSPLAH